MALSDSGSGSSPDVQYLHRPEGRIAFDQAGAGPLVVCVPGMGDIRSTFRHLAPGMADGGWRVTAMDLRGHGDSDATFSSYDDEAAASDITALVEHLGGPAILIGNSMGAAAAVISAALRPDLVRGLVLIGPFVRQPSNSRVVGAAMRVLMTPLWARPVWNSYLPKLYAGTRPRDFEVHRNAIMAALKRPGHTKAFCLTTRTSHELAETVIGHVAAPCLIVMGEQDPDFPNPAAEAAWVADKLNGEIVMVPESGHYPQSQRPEIVVPAVADFARKVGTGA